MLSVETEQARQGARSLPEIILDAPRVGFPRLRAKDLDENGEVVDGSANVIRPELLSIVACRK
jgi:hypothetical protein